jgi:anti-sigma B factor antagonist
VVAAVRGDDGAGAWLKPVSAGDRELVLELGGEIDLSTVGEVSAALTAALAARPAKVIFELRQLRFMDSSGLALLVSTAQRVEHIELRYPSNTVRRIIELAGLTGTLPIVP